MARGRDTTTLNPKPLGHFYNHPSKAKIRRRNLLAEDARVSSAGAEARQPGRSGLEVEVQSRVWGFRV